MNQIELFQQGAEAEGVNNNSRSADKRPPNISVSKVFSNNMKWKECKIIGKNISIRSYSAACSFNNRYLSSHSDSTSTEAIKSLMVP